MKYVLILVTTFFTASVGLCVMNGNGDELRNGTDGPVCDSTVWPPPFVQIGPKCSFDEWNAITPPVQTPKPDLK